MNIFLLVHSIDESFPKKLIIFVRTTCSLYSLGRSSSSYLSSLVCLFSSICTREDFELVVHDSNRTDLTQGVRTTGVHYCDISYE